MEKLFELHKSLINSVSTHYVRYLHDEIEWDARLIAILGARGVGKTTLILQHIRQEKQGSEALYILADDIYFSENTLFDAASEFYKNGGRFLYIDEIHKYNNWSQELKNIYDYFPKLKIVFTGSSILDIYKGSADLSRRALLYDLPGLSFREYLNISEKLNLSAYSFEDIISNKVVLDEIEHPLPLFKEYLQKGYYPFFAEKGYEQRLRQIVNMMLETDIPMYAKMNIATAGKMKQLLYIISQSVPFKPNYTKLAGMMNINRNAVNDFMYYLDKAGIITLLRNETQGVRLLGKVEKVYLNNTNLAYVFSDNIPDIGNIRETFFHSQLSVRNTVYSSSVSDFLVNGKIFEIGGKNKTQKQIQGVKNAFVVKDDIEVGFGNVIPLWTFGFGY